ncbi:20S core proteasome subunit beta 2 [Gracilaria domingensis]|nr:20S core proteasome subunit beta 2 [Gracilaria domingensis]
MCCGAGTAADTEHTTQLIVSKIRLYSLATYRSTDRLPFVSMGSGSLAAMAVFESKYKDGMTVEEAKQLVYEGIPGGIFNDLGSGGNFDLCIITAEGKEFIRGFTK